MATDLAKLIQECIDLKEGDKEFLVEYSECPGTHPWRAAIGNTSQYVGLGEAISYGSDAAEFYETGNSPIEAIEALLEKIKRTQRS